LRLLIRAVAAAADAAKTAPSPIRFVLSPVCGVSEVLGFSGIVD
jgi:hypothetical protein